MKNKSLEKPYEVTKASVIVDSSKISLRIPILRPMGTKVFHICRNFTGVLNSAKKDIGRI